MTSTLAVNWTEIQASEEYTSEVISIKKLFLKSLGNDEVFTEDNPLIHAASSLLAMQRYFLKHINELNDIDASPFLDLLKAETGTDLPLTSSIPVSEFLREAKAWYGHKGTDKLFKFAGGLIGSKVEVYYPYTRIFTLDSTRSCLDGDIGPQTDFNTSKVAYLEDGEYWTDFTYIINVLSGQNIENISDLYAIARNTHPAGMKQIIEIDIALWEDVEPKKIFLEGIEVMDYEWIETPYPTLDNGWLLDNTVASLDMRGGNYLLFNFDIQELNVLESITANCFKTIAQDTLMHFPPASVGNHVCFSRFKSKSNETYEEMFSDNDTIVFESCTTNMGLKDYEFQALENLTLRHLQDVAYDLDGKNPNLSWFNDTLLIEILEI